MARTTHVARAQQRYETVPVIDPTTGEPKRTPVMRNGEQRVTKRGKPIFMTVTVQDRSKPLPLENCDFCRKPIEIGTPYKHITPKSGPYGGRKRSRHEACPNWQVWEYSSSLSARLAQVSFNFWNAVADVEDTEDVQSALDDAAEEIKGIAEEKRESASNIEDGFGHPTSSSEELEQIADSLDEWAEEITAVDIPELPEPEPVSKWYVNGPDAQSLNEDGFESEEEARAALEQHLAGVADEDEEESDWDIEEVEEEGEEPTEDQMSEWRDEVEQACSIIDESPV